MKKGDIVMVYEDPYTKRREEGPAEVVRVVLHDDIDDLYEVVVRFPGERDTYRRLVVEERSA